MKKLPFFYKAETGNLKFNKGLSNQRLQAISLFLFIFISFLIFLTLLIRLFQLTIVKGEYYRRLAEENRIKEVVVEARRGKIIDRKGFVIAENQNPDTKINDPRISSHRQYIEGDALAPLIGYRQTADTEDIKNSDCLAPPRLNDKVGKKGIEKVFECELKGKNGNKLIELDAHGKYVKTLTVVPQQEGATIQLAVDLELQKKAFSLLNGRRGAIIATKPDTGEIIAFVSSPSYNPQDFEDSRDQVKIYFSDDRRPLFNRITEAAYPPGSVFKLIIAASALEDKKIDEKTIYVDTGEIKAGPFKFGNWYFLQYGKTEGPVNIVKAIRRSNDTYFYQVGDLVGPERIKYWSDKFGFGRKTSLPFEQATGLIPSPFWKEEVIKDYWYQGDNYNMSIGQGYMLVTPLQVNQATAVFANGGKLCDPKLKKGETPKCRSLNLSKKTLELIREGMRQACAPGGTGWPLFDFSVRDESQLLTPTPTPKNEKEATMSATIGKRKIAVACKTGTSENNGKSGLPHAWITAFAPYDKPEIAVTVLIEEGGQGSDVAGPVAKELLKSYFERKE